MLRVKQAGDLEFSTVVTTSPRRRSHDASFSWDFAGGTPIQTGQEAYLT
jgi:hypothetical protein